MAGKNVEINFKGTDPFDKWLAKPAVKQPKSREEVKKKQAENISKAMRKQASQKRAQTQLSNLTPREKRFCQKYVETSKAGQSVVEAGYNVSNLGSAGTLATELLKKQKVKDEINRLMQAGEDKAIATAQEVMQGLTAIARGETKDQFGLDISVSDRLKAWVELAKRTVDLEQKFADKPDNKLEITLDWKRDD